MASWRIPALVTAVAAVAAGVLWGTTSQAAELTSETDPALVATESGAVRGTVSDTTRAFQSIPYAAPPVGDLRWRDPRPPAPWEGERDATNPAPACAQAPGEVPDGSRDEDCLYLNVTTPAKKSKKKPVIVWVHGGGFYMGASSNYPAQRVVEGGDVVVVTVNYRLGVFGFFGHPGLDGSGTFGLADQQAAFGWVQRNIAKFGGDPDNVTIAGQSAGAISNCAHLTSPAAAGLFDKVIMQSGACDLDWVRNAEFRGQPADAIYEPLDRLERQGAQTAADLGCQRADTDATVECLRALPVDTLTPVLQKYIQPAYGTSILPKNPADAIHTGRFHRVPVLTGQTRDETRLPTSMYDNFQYPMSEETYDAVLTDTFGDDRQEIEAKYPRAAYDSAALAWSAITTDSKWTCNQYQTSKGLAKHVPVYHYEFADPAAPPLSPLPPAMPMGSYHSSELWSLFNLANIEPKLTDEQRHLSDQMIDYWSSFARKGNPNAAPGPRWPEFGSTDRSSRVLSLAPEGIAPMDLAAEHQCRFWESR
ncbi:carboxylesterase/lipase family protein [Actinophytocola sediminis]